jgi:signal recognition particle GTPase
MISSMANKDSYLLKDLKQDTVETIRSKSSSFKSLMQGTSEEEADMVLTKRILNSMYEDELLNINNISYTDKMDIATVVQCPIEDVNKTLKSFNQHKQLHTFLKSR